MDDTAIRRIMPHDSAAEESVVGSMLFDKEAIDLAGELLLKEDFYEKQYGIVFEAMVELNNAGKSVDMVTLQSYLKEKDVPDEIASLEFLQGIMQLYITSSNVKQYAEIVKKHSLLRRLIRVSDEISNDCYSQNKSLNVIFEDTEKKIFDIVQRKNTGDFTPINKIVETSIKRLQTIMMSGSRMPGIARRKDRATLRREKPVPLG